mmetsp:Transcript_6362/g.17323  ORF Transcript_6362/g.17323 Transcript_6362/m.17323 type:complete len:225 (+) Transcript_6362:172-846(+)
MQTRPTMHANYRCGGASHVPSHRQQAPHCWPPNAVLCKTCAHASITFHARIAAGSQTRQSHAKPCALPPHPTTTTATTMSLRKHSNEKKPATRNPSPSACRIWISAWTGSSSATCSIPSITRATASSNGTSDPETSSVVTTPSAILRRPSSPSGWSSMMTITRNRSWGRFTFRLLRIPAIKMGRMMTQRRLMKSRHRKTVMEILAPLKPKTMRFGMSKMVKLFV